MINRLIYLILAVICNTLFRYHPFCFEFGRPEENHTSFAVGQAMSWVLVLLYVKEAGKTNTQQIVYEIALWLSLSNLADELFFDPLHLGINELVFAVFIIIFTIYRCMTLKKML